MLARELHRLAARGEYGFIAVGSATEPWMPLKERYRVTRLSLEVIRRKRFPVHCLTKSPLITRDTDVLVEIDRAAVLPTDLRESVGRGAMATFSFSTLDEGLAHILEPGAPPPRERLDALMEIREAGLMAGIAFMPLLPYVTDEEIEEMARAAREAGADYVYFAPLTLPEGVRERMLAVVEPIEPGLAERYRELYGRGSSPHPEYMRRFYRRVAELLEKHGLRFGPTGLDPLTL